MIKYLYISVLLVLFSKSKSDFILFSKKNSYLMLILENWPLIFTFTTYKITMYSISTYSNANKQSLSENETDIAIIMTTTTTSYYHLAYSAL